MALKPALGWNRYLDVNPVPTSPLADDLATAPLGPVSDIIKPVVCIILLLP